MTNLQNNLNISTKSLLGDSKYNISFKKYSGVDFSKKCFVFQGQGGIENGMGKYYYENFNLVKKLFDEADKFLLKRGKQKVSDFIVGHDKIDKNKLHIYGNIALFVLEIGMFRILVDKNLTPSVVTAHSFGEYAALVACGCVSFLDMLDIVYNREFLSEEKNVLGYLVAVKESEKNILDIFKNFEGKYYLSNINSDKQVVLSVPNTELKKLEYFLNKNKLKYKVLENTPQPYHSPLMHGSREKFKKYLGSVKFKISPPEIPLFSSVLRKKIKKGNFQEKEIMRILENQLTEPVNFIYQVEEIFKDKINVFIEIGVKKIFTDIIRDILNNNFEYKSYFLDDFLISKNSYGGQSLPSENIYDGKLVKALKYLVSKTTGYDLASIRLEDRFQEELRMDSIKKADVVFRFLEESRISGDNIELSRISSLSSILDEVKNIKAKGGAENNNKTKWSRFILRENEKEIHKIQNNDKILGKVKNISFSKICSGDANDIEGVNTLIIDLETHLNHQNLKDFIFGFKKIIVDSYNQDPAALSLKNIILISYVQNDGFVLSSFFKSIKREIFNIDFKHIFFDKKYGAVKIEDVIKNEILNGADTDILYKNNLRSRNIIIAEKRGVVDKAFDKNKIDSSAVIVAIGAGTGITKSLIKNLEKDFQPIIHIIGRSNFEKIKKTDQKFFEKKNVFYHSADASRLDLLEGVVKKIVGKYKKIDFIINGAGILDINNFIDKKDGVISSEIDSKILISENVLKLKHKKGFNIGKAVLFSSIVSNYGSAGQSVYALSNAYLNKLASENDSILTINWPGWDKVGMTDNASVYGKLKEYKIPLLKERKAYPLFKKELINSKEKSVFYMTDADDNALNFMLIDLNKHKKFTGLPADKKALAANVDFLRTFGGDDDKFLQEHMVFGEITLPGSFFISSALCFSYLYNKKFISIKKIKLLSRFILKSNNYFKDKININLSNDKNVLSVSFKDSSGSIKAICHLAGADEKELKIKKDILGPSFTKNGKKDLLVKSREFYEAVSKNSGLVLGSMYKNLGDVYRTTNAKGRMYYADINLSSETFLDGSVYEKLTRIIDAGFQILGAVAVGENGKNGGLYLPTGIKEILHHGKYLIGDKLLVVLSNETRGDNFIEGDISIFNNSGEIIISAAEVRLTKVN